MKWETVKLKDCCISISDGDHLPPPKAVFGVPFVTISNIDEFNQFDFNNTMFVPKDYYEQLDVKRKPKPGDVLYSVVGSFGIPVLIKEDRPFVFQRHIAILRPSEKILPDFLYYTMLGKDFYARIDQVAVGAAQRTVSLAALRGMTISLPPMETQKAIVDKLSVYDSLIENNQKQIKLLEEAAQRLYKEWFVDLRFPGYEQTTIVDGVPEGWHYGTIDEAIEYHDKIRKPLSSMDRSTFKGKYRYYGAAGVLDYVKEYLYNGTYLLLGEDGTVITSDGYPVLQYVSGKFWVNNHAHVLTGKECYSTEYIYMLFKHTKVTDVVTGVAQPKISQARLSAKKILFPEQKLIFAYTEHVKAFFEKSLRLQEQIMYLSEARNRLLPKLINGEIEA